MAGNENTLAQVVLVGAGPGDASLASAAAIRWISRADVIVYDRLVSDSLLAWARSDSEQTFVGKTPGQAGPDQGEINEILIRQARAGKLVVRLKGGDPLVFGRGGEEAEALAEAGVPYRIVPGITAAVAAGAAAGIPLTDRRCASSVAFVTAREDPAKARSEINWQALAGIDTVVIYMGVSNLGQVAAKLIAAGRDAQTPAAIVSSAGTARQRTLVAPLAELADAAQAAAITPPAVTIVGEVVRLRERIKWAEKLPLFGRTVIVTRPAGAAGEMAAALAELGAAVIAAPAIEIAEPEDFTAIDEALRGLGRFGLVAFTSANGVAAFVRRCGALGIDGRGLGGAQVAAVGPATAEALRDRFIHPDIVAETFTTAALAEAILAAGEVAAKRILLPRADIADPALAERLRQAGAEVEEVAIYRTLRPAALPADALAALRERQVQWVTFTAASTVENFLALLGEAGIDGAQALAPPLAIAAIGPATADALAAADLAPAALADPHTIDGLIAAILEAQRSAR